MSRTEVREPAQVDACRRLLDQAIGNLDPVPGYESRVAAIRLARRALDAADFDPEDLLATGQALEDEGRLDAASDFYAEAVAYDRTSARAWTNLGEIRRKLSRWTEALSAYDEALLHEPNYLWALAGRGEVLRMLDRIEEALVPFRTALERAPDHVFAVQGLAAALSELARHREALPYWERALALRPESGFASDGLSRCHEALSSAAAGPTLTADPPTAPALPPDFRGS